MSSTTTITTVTTTRSREQDDEDSALFAPQVRFVESCTLIPASCGTVKHGLVEMTTKTVALPRMPSWTRAGHQQQHHSAQAGNGAPPSPAETARKEGPRRTASDGDYEGGNASSVTIHLPKFRRPHSKRRSSSQSPSIPPLSPCLVHRSPSSSSSSPPPTRRRRRPSLPAELTPHPDEETIPLRSCCADCFSITEEAIRDPEWKEKFTKGAERLRRSSISSPSGPTPTTTADAVKEGEVPVKLEITVDEVDIKRRKSSELGVGTAGELLVPSTGNGEHDRVSSTSSLSSISSSPPSSPLSLAAPTAKRSPSGARSSPIYELDEDEAQLFPLPSPRRTPSPAHTPSGSEGGISPNGSTSSLVATKKESKEVLREAKRNSPLCSEILPSPPTTANIEDADKDVLSAALLPSISRKGSLPIATSTIEIEGKKGNGSADEIPAAFLESYQQAHTPKAASPPTPSSSPQHRFTPFRRSSTASSDHHPHPHHNNNSATTSPIAIPIPKTPTSENGAAGGPAGSPAGSPTKVRRPSLNGFGKGFGDVLRGVSAGLSGGV